MNLKGSIYGERYVSIILHMDGELVVCFVPILIESWDDFVDLHLHSYLIIHESS